MTNGNDLINQKLDTDSEYDGKNNFHFARTYSHGKGLTKREYFAAMAMQGMAKDCTSQPLIEISSKRAVLLADALINALNENP